MGVWGEGGRVEKLTIFKNPSQADIRHLINNWILEENGSNSF